MDAAELTDLPYDALREGERMGPYPETVTPELAGRLAGAIGEPTEARFAPPGVFPVLFLRALRRSLGGIPRGAILGKQQLEVHAPVEVGAELQVTTWIGQRYLRRGRPYVVVEFDIREGDRQVVTGRKILVWPNGPRER